MREHSTKIDPAPGQLTWLIDRLLVLLSGMAAAGNAENAFSFRSELASYRDKFLNSMPDESLDTVARKCLALCQDYFEHEGSYRLNYEPEYAEIIDILREAITSLVGAQHSDGMVIGSALRFRELVAIEDIHDLKARIDVEVRSLEQVIVERQSQQKKAIRTLNQKVHGLEQKLLRTQKQLNETQEENTVDPLTKVASRRHFDRELARWVRRTRDSGRFVLAILDIDNFKRINDSFGHQMGDSTLHDVTQCIRSMIRDEDLLARYGGEEFALLMSNIDSRKAEQRCQKILSTIRVKSFKGEQKQKVVNIQVTASCGLTEFASGDSAHDILQRADAALYQAKKNGKDRVEIKLSQRRLGLAPSTKQ